MKLSLRNPKTIFTIIAVIIVLIVVLFRPKQQSPSTTTNQPISQIIPGKTTFQNTLDALGNPISTKEEPETTVLSYPSTNQYHTNDIYFANNQAVFIRQPLYDAPDTSVKSHTQNYGPNYTVLYGPDYDSGVTLITYPQTGIALLANQLTDSVYEIWHFAPTTLNELLQSSFFQDYATEPTPHQDL